MLIKLTILLIIISGISFSQITFEKWYGGNNYEEANAVVETDDGGFIVVGYTETFGAGSRDFYVIRTEPDGDTIWTKTFGGAGFDVACDIIKTDTGHYLIGGCVNSVASEGDIYLLKIDENGNTLWTKTIGTTDNEYLYKIRKTSDGGFIMCGYTEDYFEYKYYIVKTDSYGDTLWTKAYDYGRANWIEQTNDGGYILMVYRYGMLNTLEEFYLVKLDESGGIMWTRSYAAGLKWVVGYAVQQTADSGYIMAGRVNDYGAGGSDFLIIKSSSNGDSLWSKTFGGSSDERAFTLIKTSDGGFLMGGYTGTFGGGFFDFYLVKADENGDSLWTRTYGGSWQEMAYDIKETNDGGFVIAGYTQTYGSGLFDFYLVKTDANGLLTGVENQNNHRIDFELYQNYPNPFNPSTNIQYAIGSRQFVSLKIYDIIGNEVAILVNEEKPAGVYEVEFNPSSINHLPSSGSSFRLVQNLVSGVYFCRLQTENYSKTIKMLYLK